MSAFIITRIQVGDYEAWRPMFDQDRPRARALAKAPSTRRQQVEVENARDIVASCLPGVGPGRTGGRESANIAARLDFLSYTRARNLKGVKSLGSAPNPSFDTLQACRPRQDRGRRLNSSQVADAWISPLTNLQPPSASGGNMYVQRSHRTPGAGAGW